MDETQPVAKFRITCVNCDKKGDKHDTLLYVEWEKRYYMITCHKCGETEAFDEFSKKIELKEDFTDLEEKGEDEAEDLQKN